MSYYELGVIGGMGAKATSIFFDKLVERTEASCDQEHINTIILNHSTIPDRTRSIKEGKSNDFLQSIKGDFDILNQLDVKAIAIPCNTSHYYFEHLESMSKAPIINMIEETIKKCVASFGIDKPMVLMATDGTINTGVYHKYAKQHGLELINPDEEIQKLVMKTIYEDVKSGLPVDVKYLSKVIMRYVNELGYSGVILGCTELSTIVFDGTVSKFCIDAMDILVEQSIIRSGYALKY